jgi:hypothetical protein
MFATGERQTDPRVSHAPSKMALWIWITCT